jgi:hypothetical protein
LQNFTAPTAVQGSLFGHSALDEQSCTCVCVHDPAHVADPTPAPPKPAQQTWPLPQADALVHESAVPPSQAPAAVQELPVNVTQQSWFAVQVSDPHCPAPFGFPPELPPLPDPDPESAVPEPEPEPEPDPELDPELDPDPLLELPPQAVAQAQAMEARKSEAERVRVFMARAIYRTVRRRLVSASPRIFGFERCRMTRSVRVQ